MIVWTMVFAGACAGVAGWVQVAGVDHRLYATVADPVGYTGLFAALLGGFTRSAFRSPAWCSPHCCAAATSFRSRPASTELISTLIGLILLIIAGRSMMALHGRRL